MNSEVEKYLKTEREISLFRIEYLKKMLPKNEASTKRLLAIEEEFLTIPFEKMSSNLPELLSALKIFRDSRAAFHDLYKVPKDEEVSLGGSNAIELCLTSLNSEILKISREIEYFNIKDFRSNGRLLTILLCLSNYLGRTLQDLKDKNINIDHKALLEEISKKYNQDIFSLYNEIISNPDKTLLPNEDSLRAVSTAKPLENISSKNDPTFFEIRSEKIKRKNLFGFFIPLRHTGRETMRPYHLRLFDEDGFNVSKLFNLQTRSIYLKEKNEYYKFVSIVSLDEIKDNLVLLDRYQLLMKKIFHNKLSGKSGVRIDCEKSSILASSSRTEDEGLRDAFTLGSSIFSNILTKFI
jgi:hypothetical protein